VKLLFAISSNKFVTGSLTMMIWCTALLLAIGTPHPANCLQHAGSNQEEEVQGPGQLVQGPKQERNNRLVPDFQPFLHPAAKVFLKSMSNPKSGFGLTNI
jgi:hypothetical protein